MGGQTGSALFSPLGSVEVCPYAYYKELPFAGESISKFSPGDWNAAEWKAYLRSRVVPGSAGSIAALAVLITTSLAFLFWRITRCCSNLPRPRSSYPSKSRASFVRRILVKVAITLFALGGMALAITGMGIVNRSLVTEGWQVITDMGSKTRQITGAAGTLVQESSRLNPIMQQLNKHISSSVDFDTLVLHTQCVGNFLVVLGDPKLLRDGIANMGNRLNVLKPALERLDGSLTNLTEQALPSIQPSLAKVREARFSLLQWKQRLLDYYNAIKQLPPDEPSQRNNTNVRLLLRRRSAVKLSDWNANLSTTQQELQAVQNFKNSAAWQSVLNDFGVYQQLVPSMADTDIFPVGNALSYISSAYLQGGGSVCLSGVVQQVDKIDSNVAQLSNETQAAFQKVEMMDSLLKSVYGGLLTPVQYKQLLYNLGATMKSKPNTAALQTALVMGNQSVVEFPDASSAYEPYQQVGAGLQAALDPIKQLDTALLMYSNFTWNYDSIKQAAAQAEQPVATAISALQAAFDSRIVAEAAMYVRVTGEQGQNLIAAAPPLYSSMQQVGAALASVPSPQAFVPLLDSMVMFFKALPKDRRQVVQPVLQYIRELEYNTVYGPNENWRHVNATVSGFGNATKALERATTDRLEKIQSRWKAPTIEYYQTGYKAVWGLYLLLVCSLGFLLVSVWMELHWGRVSGSVLVLTTACLLLMLCVLWSALLITLHDTCANLPDVIVSKNMDPQVQSLLNFYISPPNVSYTVSSALRDAGILDVDQLYSTLNNATYNLTQEMAANFTLRPVLRGVAKSSVGLTSDLSGGIDALLRVADWQSLHGLYLAARSWLCCNVVSVAYFQWCFLLAAAALGWVTVVVVCIVIAQYDAHRKKLRAQELEAIEMGMKPIAGQDQTKLKPFNPGPDAFQSPTPTRPLEFSKPMHSASPLNSTSSSQQIATYHNDTFEDDEAPSSAVTPALHTSPSPNIPWTGSSSTLSTASSSKSDARFNGSPQHGDLPWLVSNTSPLQVLGAGAGETWMNAESYSQFQVSGPAADRSAVYGAAATYVPSPSYGAVQSRGTSETTMNKVPSSNGGVNGTETQVSTSLSDMFAAMDMGPHLPGTSSLHYATHSRTPSTISSSGILAAVESILGGAGTISSSTDRDNNSFSHRNTASLNSITVTPASHTNQSSQALTQEPAGIASSVTYQAPNLVDSQVLPPKPTSILDLITQQLSAMLPKTQASHTPKSTPTASPAHATRSNQSPSVMNRELPTTTLADTIVNEAKTIPVTPPTAMSSTSPTTPLASPIPTLGISNLPANTPPTARVTMITINPLATPEKSQSSNSTPVGSPCSFASDSTCPIPLHHVSSSPNTAPITTSPPPNATPTQPIRGALSGSSGSSTKSKYSRHVSRRLYDSPLFHTTDRSLTQVEGGASTGQAQAVQWWQMGHKGNDGELVTGSEMSRQSSTSENSFQLPFPPAKNKSGEQ